jgi:hypothetical protein
MDWIKISEIMITSITSIVVALVGAGFFKKMSDKKEKVKSRENLIEQIRKDEIVHLALRDIRRRYNADRVYVWQFHNGGNFYTTSPIQRISITYERCSDGLERKAEKNQNLIIANYSSYISDVINGDMFFTSVSKMDDLGQRSLMQSSGTKSHCSVPVYNKEKHLVAMLSLDWVFSDIPSEFIKKDGNFTQDFIEGFSTDADTLDKYL